MKCKYSEKKKKNILFLIIKANEIIKNLKKKFRETQEMKCVRCLYDGTLSQHN